MQSAKDYSEISLHSIMTLNDLQSIYTYDKSSQHTVFSAFMSAENLSQMMHIYINQRTIQRISHHHFAPNCSEDIMRDNIHPFDSNINLYQIMINLHSSVIILHLETFCL